MAAIGVGLVRRITGLVTSINTLTGAVTLAAGANVTLTPVGNTITIASTGGGGGGSIPQGSFSII
jgi:hypothetical protein